MEIDWNQHFDNELQHHSNQNLTISTDFLNTCKFDYIFSENKTVLEIGGGTGELSNLLINKFNHLLIKSTDYSETSINFAKSNYQNNNLTYDQLDLIKNDITEPYDVIISSNVLEHFKNYKLLVDKMLQHCKYAIFIIPHHETLNDLRLYENEGGICHCSSFNVESFQQYDIIDSYEFYTNGWFGPNSSTQLAVLLKGKLNK